MAGALIIVPLCSSNDFCVVQKKNKRKVKIMKKVMFDALVAAFVSGLTGCQTRITGEKYPEQVFEVKEKVTVDGKEQLITKNILVASGGWKVTARSPLYADEALKGLDFGVGTNGFVHLKLDEYRRDLSTNATVMVDGMFKNGANLVIAIGDAYVKIAGGGAQADTVTEVVKKVYGAFTSGGGDPSKATVATEGDKLTISDGSICTTCTPDGNCTTGACSE